MLFFQKKIGETPLEMLDRLRIEKTEFKNSKLSYAGRLDPMAYGEMLVLVDEENKNYKKYLGYDKEYEATFLFGVSTDTNDILGIAESEKKSEGDTNIEINIEKITKEIYEFKDIKTQKYPWFSSMVIDGLKLFDHFKKGNLEIKRPTQNVEIKNIEIISFDLIKNSELKDYIFENIKKVKGNFRQKEIIEKWQEFFSKNERDFPTVKIKITVSSGTYIRSLAENFESPALLFKLKRTKILM